MLQKVVDITQMAPSPAETIRDYLLRVEARYGVPVSALAPILEKSVYGGAVLAAEEDEVEAVLRKLQEAVMGQRPTAVVPGPPMAQIETAVREEQVRPSAEMGQHQNLDRAGLAGAWRPSTVLLVVGIGLLSAAVVILASLFLFRPEEPSTPASASTATPPLVPSPSGSVVWSYGTGFIGTGEGELYQPHMAEEYVGEDGRLYVIIAEQGNHDVIVVDKATNAIVWQFGKRGVAGPGSGTLLDQPHAAHRLPDGRFLITEWSGGRVLIVNRRGEIEWEYTTDRRGPLDAILWDDDHVMISEYEKDRVIKVRLRDKAVVWEHKVARPFYLQKLKKGEGILGGDTWGGDLLIGIVGSNRVEEVDTETGQVAWSYGEVGARWEYGVVYNRVIGAVRALRVGVGEHTFAPDNHIGVTIMVDEKNSRIFAVNKDKVKLWELGGSIAFSRPAWDNFPIVMPTYVTLTRAGNLLVTDWGLNKVYELAFPWGIPPRQRYEAQLFHQRPLGEQWVDSETAEVAGYGSVTLTAFNEGNAPAQWRVLASPDGTHWIEAQGPRDLSAGGSDYIKIPDPWRLVKVQAKAAGTGEATQLTVFIHAQRSIE